MRRECQNIRADYVGELPQRLRVRVRAEHLQKPVIRRERVPEEASDLVDLMHVIWERIPRIAVAPRLSLPSGGRYGF